MFNCYVCGNKTAKDELTNEIFTIDGRRVLVENIPAQVCERCSEATFSRETTEKIRQLVHGASKPVRTVPLEVYALA
jgi:YgiT-type zinc finger domain-containing protein